MFYTAEKMVCRCLEVGRGWDQPSQIQFVEKIKALECLSPSSHLPRALTVLDTQRKELEEDLEREA